jgi:rfaE bifunctional protein nucleotidyltransferase chain/domain
MPATSAPVLDLEQAVDVVRQWRAADRRMVMTNGCFDILHAGHLSHLQAARKLGDVLIVAVNDDDSTRALKGPGRPINGLAQRAALLAGLRCVDLVVPFGGPTAELLVARLQPDIYVKGGDYGPGSKGRMREPPEAPVARAYGATVVFLPFIQGYSTTRLIRRIAAGAGDEPVG